jgi:outer membrane protein assembly factor BamB
MLVAAMWLVALYATAGGSPFASNTLTTAYGPAADYILDQTGFTNKGYCVVFGAGEGRLAYELAARSELNFVGVDEDTSDVDAGRTALDEGDLYGVRITLHHGSLTNLPYSDYAAALVVSDSIIADGACSGSASEMFRMVRPAGGKALIGQPLGCPNVLDRTELENWLDAGGLTYTITEDANGLWAHIERGSLPGAGEWTHQFANPRNTASSEDTRTTDSWTVLWFGDPGPKTLNERHARAMASLYKAGRMIVPGNNVVMCVDAYNGARLWDLEVPNAARLGMHRDNGWVAMADDYVYVAASNYCHRVDLDTGRIADTYRTPDTGRDWGYLAVAGDLLVGSEQVAAASYIGPRDDGSIYNDIVAGDGKPVITSKALFCRNRTTGELLWTYATNSVIPNLAICVADGYVYFMESYNATAVADADGRVTLAHFNLAGSDEHLVKLDADTGEVVWRKQHDVPFNNIIYLGCATNMIVASGSDRSGSNVRYHLHGYDPADGSSAWTTNFVTSDTEGGHGVQDKHPMIIGEKIYHRKRKLDLLTGADEGAFDFGNYKCADSSASANHIFSRRGGGFSGGASITSLSSGSSSLLCSQTRPGCYVNIIPAGGVIMLPPASAGCTCTYAIQATIVWLPQ